MERTRILLTAAILIVLAAVATFALASGTGEPGEAEPMPTSGPLDGRAFIASKVVGRKLVPGTTLRLSFDEGLFSATAGCNDLDGGYALRAGYLHTARVTQTMMGCPADLEAQIDWVASVLDGAELTPKGRGLELRSGRTAITFVAAQGPPGP